MNNKQIRVRISHGEIVIELEGDSSTVISELRALKKEGIGKLSEFFGARISQLDAVSQVKPTKKPKPGQEPLDVGFKNLPSLSDIVLKALSKNEPEWIVIYSYFVSKVGQKTFTRAELWEQYKISGRVTKGRSSNLSNNIRRAVQKGWLSTTTKNTYTLLPDGINKAEEIGSRKKPPKKKIVQKKKKKVKKEGKK